MVSEIEQSCNTSNPCGIQTHCWGLIYKAAKMIKYDGTEGKMGRKEENKS